MMHRTAAWLVSIRTYEVLSRFAQIFPGQRMPDSIDELPQHLQIALAERDPDLHSLLDGTAPAELEAAALAGKISADPPPAISPQQAATQQVREMIGDTNPWLSGNLTHQVLATDHLDPALVRGWQTAAAAEAPTAEQLYEQRQQAVLADQRARVESKIQAGMGAPFAGITR
jgi:hypothetical protein